MWLRRTTFRQRREVMRYLKKGAIHPDPAIAARAYRWAKSEIEFNVFRNTKAGPLAFLAALPLGPGFTTAVFKLRLARRLAEVYDREDDIQTRQSGTNVT
jgi:hypothetical protein